MDFRKTEEIYFCAKGLKRRIDLKALVKSVFRRRPFGRRRQPARSRLIPKSARRFAKAKSSPGESAADAC